MLINMLSFCTGLLSSIASFLGTEPIIYIVGFILGITVLNGILRFCRP